MDSRILDRVNLLKQKEEDRSRQEREGDLKQRAQYKDYVESKIPEAEKWVDEVLFDQIAKVTVTLHKDSNRSIYITDSYGIPVEAKVQAIKNKNIAGISIQEQYNPEDYDPNDESHRTIMPASISYYVVWTV
jgi:hypothetical protein